MLVKFVYFIAGWVAVSSAQPTTLSPTSTPTAPTRMPTTVKLSSELYVFITKDPHRANDIDDVYCKDQALELGIPSASQAFSYVGGLEDFHVTNAIATNPYVVAVAQDGQMLPCRTSLFPPDIGVENYVFDCLTGDFDAGPLWTPPSETEYRDEFGRKIYPMWYGLPERISPPLENITCNHWTSTNEDEYSSVTLAHLTNSLGDIHISRTYGITNVLYPGKFPNCSSSFPYVCAVQRSFGGSGPRIKMFSSPNPDVTPFPYMSYDGNQKQYDCNAAAESYGIHDYGEPEWWAPQKTYAWYVTNLDLIRGLVLSGTNRPIYDVNERIIGSTYLLQRSLGYLYWDDSGIGNLQNTFHSGSPGDELWAGFYAFRNESNGATLFKETDTCGKGANMTHGKTVTNYLGKTSKLFPLDENQTEGPCGPYYKVVCIHDDYIQVTSAPTVPRTSTPTRSPAYEGLSELHLFITDESYLPTNITDETCVSKALSKGFPGAESAIQFTSKHIRIQGWMDSNPYVLVGDERIPCKQIRGGSSGYSSLQCDYPTELGDISQQYENLWTGLDNNLNPIDVCSNWTVDLVEGGTQVNSAIGIVSDGTITMDTSIAGCSEPHPYICAIYIKLDVVGEEYEEDYAPSVTMFQSADTVYGNETAQYNCVNEATHVQMLPGGVTTYAWLDTNLEFMNEMVNNQVRSIVSPNGTVIGSTITLRYGRLYNNADLSEYYWMGFYNKDFTPSIADYTQGVNCNGWTSVSNTVNGIWFARDSFGSPYQGLHGQFMAPKDSTSTIDCSSDLYVICVYDPLLVTPAPTNSPTMSPTTSTPTQSPTNSPSASPTTSSPTLSPTNSPTLSPTTSSPSESPTTSTPSKSPTTSIPTQSPSRHQTPIPTNTNPPKKNDSGKNLFPGFFSSFICTIGTGFLVFPNLF